MKLSTRQAASPAGVQAGAPAGVPSGAPAETDPNPYLAGRAAFLDVFESLAKSRRAWMLVAFGQFALLAVVVTTLARLATEARITPYVVESCFGRVIDFGPAEALKKTDKRLYIATLSQFIRDLRLVFPDGTAQKEFLFRAYAHVASGAKVTLDNYFSEPQNDPRVLGRSLSRSVDIASVLQIPKSDLWKVVWHETETPLSTDRPRTSTWEAYLTVKTQPPTTTDGITRNPLGIYVTELTWTPILKSGETAR